MKRLSGKSFLILIWIVALTPLGSWGFNGGEFAVLSKAGLQSTEDNLQSQSQIWPGFEFKEAEAGRLLQSIREGNLQDKSVATFQLALTSGVLKIEEPAWQFGQSAGVNLTYQPVFRDQGGMVASLGDLILPANNIVRVIPEEVATTPEPATLLLFGSGILGAGALARFRKRK